MRYRQHAERIHDPEFRQELLNIAAEEQNHAESLGSKIQNLGGELPKVIPVHVAKEKNRGLYLRIDLEEGAVRQRAERRFGFRAGKITSDRSHFQTH